MRSHTISHRRLLDGYRTGKEEVRFESVSRLDAARIAEADTMRSTQSRKVFAVSDRISEYNVVRRSPPQIACADTRLQQAGASTTWAACDGKHDYKSPILPDTRSPPAVLCLCSVQSWRIAVDTRCTPTGQARKSCVPRKSPEQNIRQVPPSSCSSGHGLSGGTISLSRMPANQLSEGGSMITHPPCAV
jgi:hypothetical protein